MLNKSSFMAWMLGFALASFQAIFLVACGGSGGVGSGGSGTGTVSTSGQTEGLVSGFGSLIVDGTEFTDTNAAVQTEAADGSVTNAEAKLGQRVVVSYEGSNSATVIRVLPQLIGPVTGAPDANGWLQVAQQWVQLVDTASSTASRPTTVLAGYSNFAAIAAGDELEVHGNWAQDSSRNAWVLVASRAEKRSTLAAQVLLGGVVQSIVNSTSLRLNAANGTLVQASDLPTALQAGQVVSVWTARSGLNTSPVQATRITVPGVAGNASSSDNVTLSGLASNYDPVGRTVNVQGTRITLPSGNTLDSNALQNGGYVTVSGKPGGAALQATDARVAQPGKGSPPRMVELKGVLNGGVNGINWNAASVRFTLRGTVVNATASVISNSCRQLPATVDAYVDVRGTAPAPDAAVVATAITCNAAPPSEAIVTRTGKVTSVNAPSLTLQTNATPSVTTNITLDNNTFTEQPLTSLVGHMVDVEGVLTTGGSSLRARKIKRID